MMPSNERTDAEEVAEFMEPMPSSREATLRGRSANGWWRFRWLTKTKALCEPRELDLDALHEVEAKLTDGQCVAYEIEVYAAMQATTPRPKRWHLWHATAEQKTKALAAVIRETKGNR